MFLFYELKISLIFVFFNEKYFIFLYFPVYMKYRESEKYKEIKNNLKILNLGCGNSIICEEMYDEGYLNIYNMDISSVCIETMNERNKDSRP